MLKEEQCKKDHYQMEEPEPDDEPEICDVCHGSGAAGDGTCSACGGAGII